MSDTPLFQGADEREAVYAPQQLPEGAARQDAEIEAVERDAIPRDDEDVAKLNAGIAGQQGAGLSSPGMGGPAGQGNPAAGAALADAVRDDDDEARRERAR